jgi:hypothetical protein
MDDEAILERLTEREQELETLLSQMSDIPGNIDPTGTIEDKLGFVDALQRMLEEESPNLEGEEEGKPEPQKSPEETTKSILEQEFASIFRQSETQIPRQKYPAAAGAYIAHLNDALTKRVRKDLWRWYAMSRSWLKSDWNSIPPQVWQILWKEFSVEAADNPDRLAHIIVLGGDMEAAKVPLRPQQTLQYIEALYLQEDKADAISRWESVRHSLTLDERTAVEYWALGARMLANDGKPARAQEAMDVLLNGLAGVSEARALIPIMKAWLHFDEPGALQMAWATYIRLKVWIGDQLEMQDYDEVVAMLMDKGRTDLALAVFRDMMLTGDAMASRYDSVALYQQLIPNKSLKSLKSFKIGPEETKWTSSNKLTALPAKFRNKFFFGSWLKKLVGDGQVDWAANVVELMSQRGIRPDATYLNGIIGAWFRTGAEESIERGTEMGWKMIAARLEFVRQRAQQRQANYEFDRPVRLQMSESGKDDFVRPSTLRVEAKATLETFSVLLQHYMQVGDKARVQELLSTLKAAEIRPTAPFVNTVLELGTIIKNRPWVWNLFVEFVDHEHVTPDQDMMTLMWKNMKDNVDPVITPSLKNRIGFPEPRVLFAAMVRSCTPKKEAIPRELYDQIILCFGLSDDQIGTAVALRAMQRIYGVYPTESTVRSVVLQLAKVNAKNVAGYRPRRLNINKDTQRRITEIGDILKSLKEQRAAQLEAQGVVIGEMSAEQQAEESLKLICTLLKRATEARLQAPRSPLAQMAGVGGVDYLARTASKEMGVLEVLPWAP